MKSIGARSATFPLYGWQEVGLPSVYCTEQEFGTIYMQSSYRETTRELYSLAVKHNLNGWLDSLSDQFSMSDELKGETITLLTTSAYASRSMKIEALLKAQGFLK